MYLQVGNARILQESLMPEKAKAEQTKIVQDEKQSDLDSSERQGRKGVSSEERTEALEFAIGSTKKHEYSLVGVESDIEALDIEKAISDMQKDSILQEYQYFVKSARED